MTEKTNLRVIYCIIFAFFIGHLIYLNTPFVNLEWLMRVGSKYFTSGDNYFLDFYLNHQANPLPYSFLSSLIVNFVGDHTSSYRILALTGGLLILISLIHYKSPFLILIVALNPLVWIYSGRAYSDLLSVGLLVLAIELHKNGFMKGLLAGFSACIKYHSILFSGTYWALKWIENLITKKKFYLKNIYFISGFLATILILSFLFSYDYLYDVWIVPESLKPHESVSPNMSEFLNNFFGYGFYLSALFFITMPFFLINIKLKNHAVALLISIPLALINQNTGEMNFGSLDQLLGNELILLIKIIGFWNFLMCINYFLKNKESRTITITILIFILILSATRPAQRYLLFLVPFWSILIVQSNIKIYSLLKWSYIAFLLLVASFSSLYQIANANAASEIVAWAQKENLTMNTYEIYAHAGDSCVHIGDSHIGVELFATKSDEILFSKPVSIFGFELKRYFVVITEERKNKAQPIGLAICKN